MRYVIGIVGMSVFLAWDLARNDGDLIASFVAEIQRVAVAIGF